MIKSKVQENALSSDLKKKLHEILDYLF